eukprot:3760854-Rhodomonas_salina.2
MVDDAKGIALRFPRLVRVRDDKPPELATNSTQRKRVLGVSETLCAVLARLSPDASPWCCHSGQHGSSSGWQGVGDGGAGGRASCALSQPGLTCLEGPCGQAISESDHDRNANVRNQLWRVPGSLLLTSSLIKHAADNGFFQGHSDRPVRLESRSHGAILAHPAPFDYPALTSRSLRDSTVRVSTFTTVTPAIAWGLGDCTAAVKLMC